MWTVQPIQVLRQQKYGVVAWCYFGFEASQWLFHLPDTVGKVAASFQLVRGRSSAGWAQLTEALGASAIGRQYIRR